MVFEKTIDTRLFWSLAAIRLTFFEDSSIFSGTSDANIIGGHPALLLWRFMSLTNEKRNEDIHSAKEQL